MYIQSNPILQFQFVFFNFLEAEQVGFIRWFIQAPLVLAREGHDSIIVHLLGKFLICLFLSSLVKVYIQNVMAVF